ncbi:MAG: hypothetical protein ABSG25_05275 [Bryobacteraceae bacterium]
MARNEGQADVRGIVARLRVRERVCENDAEHLQRAHGIGLSLDLRYGMDSKMTKGER